MPQASSFEISASNGRLKVIDNSMAKNIEQALQGAPSFINGLFSKLHDAIQRRQGLQRRASELGDVALINIVGLDEPLTWATLAGSQALVRRHRRWNLKPSDKLQVALPPGDSVLFSAGGKVANTITYDPTRKSKLWVAHQNMPVPVTMSEVPVAIPFPRTEEALPLVSRWLTLDGASEEMPIAYAARQEIPAEQLKALGGVALPVRWLENRVDGGLVEQSEAAFAVVGVADIAATLDTLEIEGGDWWRGYNKRVQQGDTESFPVVHFSLMSGALTSRAENNQYQAAS